MPVKKLPRDKVARQRAKAEQRDEKDKRVRLLMDMLMTGQYIPYITPTELGKQWDMQAHNVEIMAGQAARFLRLRLADDDVIGVTLLGGLQVCFARSVEDKETGDAVKAALGILGIRNKMGIEKRHIDGGSRSETFEVELSLIDEARRAAAENDGPAPASPTSTQGGPT